MTQVRRDRVITLSELLLDGNISRTERSELEDYIENSTEALDIYLSVANQEYALSKLTAHSGKAAISSTPEPPRPWLSLGGAALACAAIIAVLFFAFYHAKPTLRHIVKNDLIPIRFSGAVGLRWANGQKTLQFGDSLIGQQITIGQGVMELSGDDGTVIVVEGPASFRMKNDNRMEIDYGSYVADVPQQGQILTIAHKDHLLKEKGTKFGMHVAKADPGSSPEIVVFDGELEVHPANRKHPIKLGKYDAVILDHRSEAGVFSIPLDKKKYVRELPLKETPWDMNGTKRATQTILTFDVTALVRGPGRFFAALKWMRGKDQLFSTKISLLRDGEEIHSDEHFGVTGSFPRTQDNIYWLNLEESQYVESAVWTLEVICECPYPETKERSPTDLADSRGILYFDDAVSLPKHPDAFHGNWRYTYNGKEYERKILPGGKCFIRQVNGRIQSEAKWWMEDEVMYIHFPENGAIERHLLRDSQLLFLDRPYRNAKRFAL